MTPFAPASVNPVNPVPHTRRALLAATVGLMALPLTGEAKKRARGSAHGAAKKGAVQAEGKKPNFRYQRTIGQTDQHGPDNDQFANPWDVALQGNRLYVADPGNIRVQVFRIAKNGTPTYERTIGETGVQGTDDDHFRLPNGVAIQGNRLYVADSGGFRVQVFLVAKDGTPSYERTIGTTGEQGTDNDHFAHLTGLALQGNRLVVSDSDNNRVQVFTIAEDGTPSYKHTIGTTGEHGDDNDHFYVPVGLALRGNLLFVADPGNNRVQVFTIAEDGTPSYKRTIGTTGESGTDNDHFNAPHYVAIKGNRLLVSDGNNHRVQIFSLTKNGKPKYLTTIGKTGDGGPDNEQLDEPRGLVLAGKRLYIADTGNQRVQIFKAK